MTIAGVAHILFFFLAILALTKPIGAYMYAVVEGRGAVAERIFAPVERVIYRVFFVDDKVEMDWKRYAISVVLFSALSMFAVYVILRAQGGLPLNPQEFPGASAHLSFNTAESDLHDLFSAHGTVDSCRVITDRETGRPRGFAFVEMSTKAEGEAAMSALSGKEVDGRALTVNEAKPMTPNGGNSRGGGRNSGFRSRY